MALAAGQGSMAVERLLPLSSSLGKVLARQGQALRERARRCLDMLRAFMRGPRLTVYDLGTRGLVS